MGFNSGFKGLITRCIGKKSYPVILRQSVRSLKEYSTNTSSD